MDLGGIFGPAIPIPPSLKAGEMAAFAPPSIALPSPKIAPLPGPAPAASAAAPPAAVRDILAQSDPGFETFWARMVPGESGGRDVPNFRYDPGHTASGMAQITDTNWRAWAPKLGIDVSRYPTAMSAPGDYQKAVAKLMHRALGAAPWDVAHGGSLPAGGLSPESSRLYTAANDEMRAAAEDFRRRLQNVSAGDEEFGKLVRETQARMSRAQEAMMAAVSKVPQAPQPDIGRLGNLATIIGMAAGLFARQPLIGMLQAGAAAIGAANQGDWQRYKAGMDAWKMQSDMLMRIADMQQRQLQDILADRSRDMKDRLAIAGEFLRANRMGPQLEMLEAGQIDKAMELGVQMQANIARFQAENARLPLLQAQTAEAEAKAQQTEAQNRMMPSGRPEPGARLPEDWPGKPDTPPPGSGIDPGVWSSAVVYVRSGGAIRPPFSLWGTNPLALAFNQAVPLAEKALGIPPSQIASIGAAYQGERSAQRAAGTRLVNLATAINEATQMAPAVVQAMARISPHEWPRANDFTNWLNYETGSPDVVRARAALNSFLNMYARGINPSGHMTDQQQRHAYEILTTAMNHGQIAAGVDQLLYELKLMRAGLNETVGAVPEMFEPHTQAPAAAAPQYHAPGDVRQAYHDGKIDRATAERILRDQFGMQ